MGGTVNDEGTGGISVQHASNVHPKRRLLKSATACLSGLALVATSGVAMTTPAAAAPQQNDGVVEVKDGAGSWAEQAYECTSNGAYLTPQQDDVAGPQRAPFGSGSHSIQINEYTTQTELYRTAEYDGTPLAELDRLEYSSFARANDPSTQPDRQPTYLRLTVDKDGDQAPDDSLFFIPANNSGQQPVANGEWQNWDVDSGQLSVNGDSGPGNTVTLQQYADSNPGATLVNNGDGSATGGSIALVTGCGMGGDTDSQRNGDYFVDRVIVGAGGSDTLYDFEGPEETDQGTTMDTVDPGSTSPWTSQAYDYQTGNTLNSNQTFVAGPGTPPLNRGSLRFTVSDDTNPNRIEQFRTGELDGRLLRDVRDLSYSTFVDGFENNTTPQQPPYLYLRVDSDGAVNDSDTSDDHVLFFYPGNNAQQQPVAQNEWQTWNAGEGRWNLGGDDGPANAFTLEQYLAEHPDATVINNSTDPSWSGGGATIQVGAGGSSQTNADFYVDNVVMTTSDAETSSTVSGTQYDLEPEPAPAAPPQLNISDTSVNEGNSGTTNASFTISMDKPTDRAVTVDYATSDGSATAPDDYASTSATATIPEGETRTTVSVPVNGDTAVEGDETFSVDLTKPQNATIGDASGTGTITNDDTPPPPPNVSIEDENVSEGDSGTSNASFTVSLDRPSDEAVSVRYATGDQSATAGDDYQSTSGTATIAAGQTETTVNVSVNGDTDVEEDETFTVELSQPQNATIGDGSGTGTITNDDEEAPPPSSNSISVSNDRVPEGNSGTSPEQFVISMEEAQSTPTSVNYATGDDTANAGSDYRERTGVAVIPAGETQTTVNVPVNGDIRHEPGEQFTLTLSNPQGSGNPEIGDGTGVGTIVNDDTNVDLSASNAAGRHVRAVVSTTPQGPGDTVRIWQQRAGDDRVVYKGTLNDRGRVNTVLDREFANGANVRLYARVITGNGMYQSETDSVTID
jgi:hypothetical protein